MIDIPVAAGCIAHKKDSEKMLRDRLKAWDVRKNVSRHAKEEMQLMNSASVDETGKGEEDQKQTEE